MIAFFITLIPSGATFLLVGWMLQRFPPKRINRWSGYRTRRSMKDQAHWDFAQRFSGRASMQLGAGLVACICLPLAIPMSSTTATLVAVGLVLLGAVLLICRTERAMIKEFGA